MAEPSRRREGPPPRVTRGGQREGPPMGWEDDGGLARRRGEQPSVSRTSTSVQLGRSATMGLKREELAGLVRPKSKRVRKLLFSSLDSPPLTAVTGDSPAPAVGELRGCYRNCSACAQLRGRSTATTHPTLPSFPP